MFFPPSYTLFLLFLTSSPLKYLKLESKPITGGLFRVSFVIDLGGKGHWYLENMPYNFYNRPTLGCSHWWEFVYTECCHDIILRASTANVQRHNVIF